MPFRVVRDANALPRDVLERDPSPAAAASDGRVLLRASGYNRFARSAATALLTHATGGSPVLSKLILSSVLALLALFAVNQKVAVVEVRFLLWWSPHNPFPSDLSAVR
jgi:hypothetical protein